MKYANLLYVGGEDHDDKVSRINLGDYMQLLAIDYMYQKMGIPKDEIYYISIKEIGNYVGEYLVLPINFMMMDRDFCKEGKIIISEYIIPVFIGICLYRDGFTLSEYNIEYFKKNAPIGCRDYGSYITLKKYGVPAYLAGCISITLPRRPLKEYETVYFVDAPEFIKNDIPKEFLQCCKFLHHERELSKEEYYDKNYARNIVIDLLKEYRNQAKLIITSRLHCAAPCMGLGIPTIIVREYKGYTFDWINQFTNIYLYQNLKDIDWYPEVHCLEKEKQIILDTAIERIRETERKFSYLKLSEIYTKWTDNCEVYQNCQFIELSKIQAKIAANWPDRETEILYALWGISESAEAIYQYIRKCYRKAKLVKIIDTYREVEFHGIKSEKPDILKAHNDFFIIVVSVNAVNAAKVLFKRIGKTTEEYLLMADTFLDESEI